MANEVAASEYGVMSAAQLMATQVGEVAGIQVVLTLQESLARHAGLENVHHSTQLLHSFQVGFWVAALVAGPGLLCASFMRPLARGAVRSTGLGAGPAGSAEPALADPAPQAVSSLLGDLLQAVGHLGGAGVGARPARSAGPSAWPCRPRP